MTNKSRTEKKTTNGSKRVVENQIDIDNSKRVVENQIDSERIHKYSENSKRIVKKVPYESTWKSRSGTFLVIVKIIQTCLLPYAVFSRNFDRILTCKAAKAHVALIAPKSPHKSVNT